MQISNFIYYGCLLLTLSVKGQKTDIETEKWNEKPVLRAVNPKYSNEPAYIVNDTRKSEFIDDTKDLISEYYTLHKIIHLNDDHGIEYFNKIYIRVNDFSDVIDIKARTILPNGNIINLDKNNIKDLKEEDGNLYKIFAMEGLEKGCEVEYFYTSKRNTSYFGREIVQNKFPIEEVSLEVIAPSRLVFETKSYNCTSENHTDTLANGKSVLRIKLKDIPGAQEEKYSAYQVNLGRVEYKLSYNNSAHPGERLFTWNDMAKKVYAMYTYSSEKEFKKVVDFVDEMGWDKLQNETDKIIAVENYIKKNINSRDDLNTEDANNLDKIIKTKISSSESLTRLYSAIFKILTVNFQLVFTADRNDMLIDKNFENWNNCDYPLFYFPSEKKFITPTKVAYRYPLIMPDWGSCNGVFCKNISIGNLNTAIAEIKQIPLEDFIKSYQNVESSLKFNSTMDTLRIDMKLLFGGYPAAQYRENFNYMTPEQSQDIVKDIVKRTTGSESIISSGLENVEFENAGTAKPFILHASVNSVNLFERAGNKILLKVGLVIGPQVEMYQEKVRQTQISMDFPHFEERKIEFTIPEGYIIKNPDDIKMNQTYKENGVQTMGFVSDYQLNGNLLTIHIMEDYRRTDYPISQYEDFVKIINASSDFNKIVLVLEKK